MRLHVLAIRDVKGDFYRLPYFAPSLGEAERSFFDECNRASPDNILYLHPEDFELRQLGSFETETGRFELLIESLQLAVGSRVSAFGAGAATADPSRRN